ncbi:MAG: monofunctional biosynthetic peptidoglycan transglycosylase [Bacteroidales bacterium]|nr:monofunctional biosynthetic peptidoglycan transglycosylase [Candidatus Colimorpha onthohippi]
MATKSPRSKRSSKLSSSKLKSSKTKSSKRLKPWGKLGFLGKVWRVVWLLAVGLWALSVVLVLLYKFVNPPLTPLMVQRFFQQLGDSERVVNFERKYVPIEEISPNLITAVVYSEDGLFMYHHGYDVKQIKQSYLENKKGRRIRGGSTISMQTAKNAFLPHTRNYLRKAFEFYFTQMIEWVWGKKRIMEVYLNIIEYGDGIYGCEAASQHYFGHSCKQLSKREASQLAVSLPGPLKINPEKNGPYFRRQTQVVMSRFSWGRVNIDMTKEQREKRYSNQENLWDLMVWFLFHRND